MNRRFGVIGLDPATEMLPLDRVEVEYEGRFLIDSRTKTFDGGVFIPKKFRLDMEAIVVDSEKDLFLRNELLSMKQFMSHEMQKILGKNDVEKMMRKIKFSILNYGKEKILSDFLEKLAWYWKSRFPYSYVMLNDSYFGLNYGVGKKFGLGVFLRNQNMVCRHYALLMAISLEFLRSEFGESEEFESVKFLENHFMAESIMFMDDRGLGVRDGHAYLVSKVIMPDVGLVSDFFVIDLANKSKQVFSIEDIRKGFNYDKVYFTRLIFSIYRILIRERHRVDPELVNWLESLPYYDENLGVALSEAYRVESL